MSNKAKIKSMSLEVGGYRVRLTNSEVIISSNGCKVSYDLTTKYYGLLSHFIENIKNGTEEERTEAEAALTTICGVSMVSCAMSSNVDFCKLAIGFFNDLLNNQGSVEETETFGEAEYNRMLEEKEKDKKLFNQSDESI